MFQAYVERGFTTSQEYVAQMFLKNLRGYLGDHNLTEIDERTVVEYRNYRRRQLLKRNPKQL
jgi:hypothetical protein